MWNYDQRIKILLDRLTFQIQYVQHIEWFIMGRLPHIWFPLTQQMVTMQSKELNIAMCVESIPEGGESLAGLAHVQS